MRIILFFLFTFFFAGCIGIKSTSMEYAFNGTWIPMKQEIGGTILPAASFEKQKLILKDTTYTVIAENIDKGIVRYTDNKLDIYGKQGPNAGKHFTAILKYENDQLTICYNLQGDSYPEMFETKDQPLYFLSVFKKQNN